MPRWVKFSRPACADALGGHPDVVELRGRGLFRGVELTHERRAAGRRRREGVPRPGHVDLPGRLGASNTCPARLLRPLESLLRRAATRRPRVGARPERVFQGSSPRSPPRASISGLSSTERIGSADVVLVVIGRHWVDALDATRRPPASTTPPTSCASRSRPRSGAVDDARSRSSSTGPSLPTAADVPPSMAPLLEAPRPSSATVLGLPTSTASCARVGLGPAAPTPEPGTVAAPTGSLDSPRQWGRWPSPSPSPSSCGRRIPATRAPATPPASVDGQLTADRHRLRRPTRHAPSTTDADHVGRHARPLLPGR